jgi:hypothetical protein
VGDVQRVRERFKDAIYEQFARLRERGFDDDERVARRGRRARGGGDGVQDLPGDDGVDDDSAELEPAGAAGAGLDVHVECLREEARVYASVVAAPGSAAGRVVRHRS